MFRIRTLCLALVGALAISVSAQDNDDVPIISLVYMQADNGSEYVDMERELWMPVHANRIREGKLLGWYLYEVVNPLDGQHNYNYLIAEVYPNWASTEAPIRRCRTCVSGSAWL